MLQNVESHGLIWGGRPTLFAQACLSKYLGQRVGKNNKDKHLVICLLLFFFSSYFSIKHVVSIHYNVRASVKQTYDVNYALRLPPDGQIERQRRTADFGNFFCLSEIDTRDDQNCQRACPLLMSCMMFAPPTYRKFAYLC